jgi:TPP-dependent pyruvate/acetoin dehydrogenase alpha subunit
MTKDELIDFETEVASDFNAGKIRYPIHLESGNEDALIEIFKSVEPQDYVFVTWRGHSKALLKGVPRGTLRAAIHRGESMALRFPEHRVYGSAIVGGTIPIALGAALAIKRRGGDEYVHCWVGDMTSLTGLFHECYTYSRAHELPIRFIIENNGVSVCTKTESVWPGVPLPTGEGIVSYDYKSKYPHAGSGRRIQF